jgi:hypothetical protein
MFAYNDNSTEIEKRNFNALWIAQTCIHKLSTIGKVLLQWWYTHKDVDINKQTKTKRKGYTQIDGHAQIDKNTYT